MKLFVGAAKVNINPTPDMFPIPSTFCDMGMGSIPQEVIYDDCFCRGIAIDNECKKLLLLIFDMGEPPLIEEMPGAISKATGFDKDDILMMGTHNHTCPRVKRRGKENIPEEAEFRDRYHALVKDAAVEAARQAVEKMKPARLGFGETQSHINVNRDTHTRFGYWIEAPNPEGFSDHTLAMLKFIDGDGKMIAALLNHATHAVVGHHTYDAEHRGYTSGNFPGVACRFVEEYYGNGAICAWCSGAAGDQDPYINSYLHYEYADGYSTQVGMADGAGLMLMEYIGRKHGSDAVRGLEEIKQYYPWLPIVHIHKNLELPAQKALDKNAPESGTGRIFRMGGMGLRPESIPFGEVPAVPELPKMTEDLENPQKAKMQLILLGYIALITCSGEIYNRIGWDLKQESPFKHTVVITHSEMEKVGYVLDSASKDHKVFQAFSTRVLPGASDDLIMRCAQEMFEEALISD